MYIDEQEDSKEFARGALGGCAIAMGIIIVVFTVIGGIVYLIIT